MGVGKKPKKKIEEIFNRRTRSVFDLIKVFHTDEKPTLREVPHTSFTKSSALIICKLLSKIKKGLVISYSLDTRTLADTITDKGYNPDNLQFIDGISLYIGKGTPPVHNIRSISSPDDFMQLFYYTLVKLRVMNSCPLFVAIIAPHAILDYTNCDEIAVFFRVYIEKLNQKGIPVIFIYDDKADFVLKRILRRVIARILEQS